MDNWINFPKKELMLEIYLSEQNMDDEILLFWNQIKTSPEIWLCKDVIEDNFWAIAHHQNFVIWYNDIEEGFNLSRFKTKGQILEYRAFKNELNAAIIALKNKIEII